MAASELYDRFMALHTREGGFVLPNAWDGLSALMLADGRHGISREEHLDHARLLGRLTGLPINGDFEDGYGATPEDVAGTVERAVQAGLAGIGIEDTSGNPDQPIRDVDDAVDRVRSAVVTAIGPTTVAELQQVGVKRISLGPALCTHAIGARVGELLTSAR